MLLLTRLKNLLIEHRCTGHCCKAFILPDGPPMNLQRKKEIILEHNKNTDYEQDILKVKKALVKRAKSKGLYENFGEKELRKLFDTYGTSNFYVQQFYDWCLNCDLQSIKSETF